MRFYPAAPYRRAATIGADVVVVLLVVLFAVFAFSVHGAVTALAEIPSGVAQAGADTRQSLQQTADRVAGVPIVGGALAEALRDGAESTGGKAVALGEQGRRDVEHAARVLGWAVFLIPTLLLLVGYGPNRYAQVERLSAARRALGDGATTTRNTREVALRAACSLPYTALLRHTKDPFGDLARGEYAGLVRAAREDAGLPLDPER